MSHCQSLLKCAMIFIALAVGVSCGGEGSSPENQEAAKPRPTKSAPLLVTWDGKSLWVSGDAPRGWGTELLRAIEASDSRECDVSHTEITVAVEREDMAALPPVPTADIAELICASKSFDVEFNWTSRMAEGLVIFRDLRFDAVLGSKYDGRVVDGWTYILGLDVDRDASPSGYGSIELSTLADSRDATWSIEAVTDGETVEKPVRHGWTTLLKSGIYKASNGDHFAIREGFRTRFVPGNPAALFFGGRRFPLDDDVPIYPGVVALGPDSTDPDSIDSCKLEVEMTKRKSKKKEEEEKVRCGPRKDASGAQVEVADIGKARSLVNQVVFHIDGCNDTPMGLRVLRARSMSTHIAIDFDGTIFQSVDLSLSAFHSDQADNQSIGLDFNNLMSNLVKHPDASMYPEDHPRIEEMRRHPRPKSGVKTISFSKVQAYGFTEAQWRSGLAVTRLLLRVFPGIEGTYPMSPDKELIRTPLEDAPGFHGFMAHFHWNSQRWDPGPGFDWERLATAFRPKAGP